MRWQAFVTTVCVVALVALLTACNTETTPPTDGDASDGDLVDGDSDGDGDELCLCASDSDCDDGMTCDGAPCGTCAATEPDGDLDDEIDPETDGDADGDVDDGYTELVPSWPACDTGEYSARYLIAGPKEAAYDATLAQKADRYDRQFHIFAAYPYSGTTDASVLVADTEDRDLITAFLTESDSWDFESYSGGKTPEDVIDGWFKTAGLYAGMGIVADALKYQTLRDQGAPCADVDRARETLKKSLDFLHVAFTVGGTPGVVARGLVRRDVPGFAASVETLPLKDENGDPLPATKNNGEWREDVSGEYPGWVWEDSCSRDMLLGWAAAIGVGMEVIRYDESFDETLKDRIRSDAKGVLDGLRTVRESGYDLELIDADGRTTLHGYLNERAIESQIYSDNFENGFYSLMALGIVSAFAYASDDPSAWDYLYNELIEARELPRIALEHPTYINMGASSNFSNYSMAFSSAWLAMRYIGHAEARRQIIEATNVGLYDTPGETYQPVGAKMSLYDFTVAYGDTNASIFALPQAAPRPQPVADGLETLNAYVTPPYWDLAVVNCDEDELASGQCELLNGDQVEVYDEGGRKGSTVCDVPVPKEIRRPSNYEWRSNPYEPNGGGDGSNLLSGVDFRIAYWIGRSIRMPAED
jgi:hypothetical protein